MQGNNFSYWGIRSQLFFLLNIHYKHFTHFKKNKLQLKNIINKKYMKYIFIKLQENMRYEKAKYSSNIIIIKVCLKMFSTLSI